MPVFAGRPLLLAVFSGLLLALAYPGGTGIWPLLAFALVPLLAAVRQGSARLAFGAGLAAGLVHFLSLLYWIVIVLGHYGGLPWFLSLPALFLLALYMALYVGLFAVGARFLLLSLPAAAVLWLLPALWVGLDWLRGVLFSGFPWMDPGYALWRQPLLIQTADLFGHHGITYLLLLVNTLLALLLAGRGARGGRAALIGPVVLLLAAVSVYSVWRWQQVEDDLAVAGRMSIGIVQGNIDQNIKWSPEHQEKTVVNYMDQTASLFGEDAGARRPVLVVWPETALPFYPMNNAQVEKLQGMNARFDMALLTGAPWYEVIDQEKKVFNFFNSALLIAPSGEFIGRYEKSHLVPFGEYVPLKPFLPFLAPLVESVGDFTPGTISRPLAWRQARLGVLICFESIFPDIARKWVKTGANVLVNLTNDAWYGKSSAPYHSLAMSVFRAVETRRSLVRAANTGISGFVDPLGRLVRQSGLFEPWAVAEEVVLLEDESLWVRGGYLFAPLCLLVMVVVVGGLAVRGGGTLRKM
jgi:apolipoprotein N-acyltransferase